MTAVDIGAGFKHIQKNKNVVYKLRALKSRGQSSSL